MGAADAAHAVDRQLVASLGPADHSQLRQVLSDILAVDLHSR